jgi:hypothetical protein
MNGVDTIRSREEPTFILYYEYEAVHHLMKKKNQRKKMREKIKKNKKEMIPPSESPLQLVDCISTLTF